MDSIIWIGISPDLLLGGLDTQTLLQSEHFLEFKIEAGNYGTKKAVKQDFDSDASYSESLNNEEINVSPSTLKIKNDVIPLDEQNRMEDQSKMNNQVIKCDQCNKLFKLRKSLVRHKKFSLCIEQGVKKGENYVRPSLAPKTCPECGKTISGTKNLNKHIKSVHLNIKVFKHKCSQCDRGFVRNIHLTSHVESVHQKETFGCVYCPRIFHASAYFRYHMKRQHNNTAVECHNCHQKFVNMENLDIHIQKGICSEENKEIHRQKKKKRNQRRVSCPYCQMNITKCKLKNHVDNVHLKGSGVSPLGKTKVCGYCDFQTPFNKKLHTHIKIIHPTIVLPNEVEM